MAAGGGGIPPGGGSFIAPPTGGSMPGKPGILASPVGGPTGAGGSGSECNDEGEATGGGIPESFVSGNFIGAPIGGNPPGAGCCACTGSGSGWKSGLGGGGIMPGGPGIFVMPPGGGSFIAPPTGGSIPGKPILGNEPAVGKPAGGGIFEGSSIVSSCVGAGSG